MSAHLRYSHQYGNLGFGGTGLSRSVFAGALFKAKDNFK
jgi:hypothetical protein